MLMINLANLFSAIGTYRVFSSMITQMFCVLSFKNSSSLSYVIDLKTEEPLGPNQQGELRIKSKAMTKGFHNMDASSEFDSEGFLKTGDLAYYDEDFCFYVTDRLKEMLKYRSWQIAPAKIENIILHLPAVKQVAVIGLPHPADGDHIMAVVVADQRASGLSEKDIEEYVNERVSDEQKLRGGVKFIKQLPMTPTGKIKRRELKQLVLSRMN